MIDYQRLLWQHKELPPVGQQEDKECFGGIKAKGWMVQLTAQSGESRCIDPGWQSNPHQPENETHCVTVSGQGHPKDI